MRAEIGALVGGATSARFAADESVAASGVIELTRADPDIDIVAARGVVSAGFKADKGII